MRVRPDTTQSIRGAEHCWLVVEKEAPEGKCHVARDDAILDNRARRGGSIRPSHHVKGFRAPMPLQRPSLPPSSPLAIEPISMRVPDACRFTGISRSTLYLLIARGEVEIVKMGAATLVLTESLRELIERQRGTSPSPTAVAIRSRSDPSDRATRDRQRGRTRPDGKIKSFPLFDRE